ncbi:hypothetical protein VNO78_30727 [Psophocarpus tetragonolobus]|uniref:Uncharacterized protein n=1 Tax=Psophocarpus tetragonolobus TaxID=3891 RepID=A0AAN9X603_PSOTE
MLWALVRRPRCYLSQVFFLLSLSPSPFLLCGICQIWLICFFSSNFSLLFRVSFSLQILKTPDSIST